MLMVACFCPLTAPVVLFTSKTLGKGAVTLPSEETCKPLDVLLLLLKVVPAGNPCPKLARMKSSEVLGPVSAK